MSTVEALKAFQDAAASLKLAVTTDKLALDAKVREAKAVLDSVTGEQAQHTAMVVLADSIDLLTRGEAAVSKASPTTVRAYVYGSASVILAGLAAYAHWGLKLF